eukprot:9485421-Pyramimonas_sp.AAC.1
MRYSDMYYDAYFIRPTSGHSSLGIKCLEFLYMRISDISAPGAQQNPVWFTHGFRGPDHDQLEEFGSGQYSSMALGERYCHDSRP